MKDTIDRLIQLQQVDSKIMDLEHFKGDLPETVQRLQEELKTLNTVIREKKNKIEEAKKERRLKEGELTLTLEKLKKHQNQLYDVTTNREYDAITQEIEQEKENISACESRILDLDIIDEEITKELEESAKAVVNIQIELAQKESELAEVEKENKDHELQLFHEREKIVARLNKNIIYSYRRILDAKNGLAVVPVTRNACGGCYNTIPPQKIVEIRKKNRLYNCEVCGRILVWQGNGHVEE